MGVGANDQVNVAVIGLGWPGQRHIEGYLKDPHARLVAICDVSAPLLESTQANFGIPDALSDYRALLARPDIDAVSICLPNWLHSEVSIAAIEAGKHVLCEKPLANTLAEGERLTATVHAHDRIFMLALNNRFRVEMQALKRIVESGQLGDIYYARAGWLRRRWAGIVRGWFTDKERSGGGPLIDLGVHMLDLTLWLMGNPKAVRVSGAVYHHLANEMSKTLGAINVEDLGSGMIHLDNGATIMLETSWMSYIERELIYTELMGTQGGAKYERGATSPTGAYTMTAPFQIFTTLAAEQVNAVPTNLARSAEDLLLTSFANETAHFVECVRENREPIATVDQGLEILRILDAVYRSAAEGREIVLTPSAV